MLKLLLLIILVVLLTALIASAYTGLQSWRRSNRYVDPEKRNTNLKL